MSSRGIGGWIWSVSFSLWTLSTVYLCDWVNTSWAVCSDQPGVLQWFHLLIWICILFVPIWSQYTVPHSDPSLVSILFEHIILKLMCFLWNSGHFSSHFRTFLVEFCRDRRLRAFFVNSGLFSSHFRTFIVEFCRDRRLRAFPKILKILASSLFYRTQVNLGSDSWVRMSVRPSETLLRLDWCDSGWWRYQLNTGW